MLTMVLAAVIAPPIPGTELNFVSISLIRIASSPIATVAAFTTMFRCERVMRPDLWISIACEPSPPTRAFSSIVRSINCASDVVFGSSNAVRPHSKTTTHRSAFRRLLRDRAQSDLLL